jgi:hypothetical protein
MISHRVGYKQRLCTRLATCAASSLDVEIPLGRIPSELDSVPRPKTFSGAVVVAGSLAPYDKKLMDGISKVTAATECLVSRGGSQGDPVGSVVRVYG